MLLRTTKEARGSEAAPTESACCFNTVNPDDAAFAFASAPSASPFLLCHAKAARHPEKEIRSSPTHARGKSSPTPRTLACNAWSISRRPLPDEFVGVIAATHLNNFPSARLPNGIELVSPPREASDGVGSDAQTTVESIVAALPEMAKYLASIPDAQKAVALVALENHYLQTAKDLGYSEEPARVWVGALIAHLKEQLEQMSVQLPPFAVGAAPKASLGLADKLLTRVIGAAALMGACPLFGFIWIGLKLEHSGPVIELRKAEYGRSQIYCFVLGSGHVSRFVRQANLQSLPSLWHLLNGDTVIRVRDLARIVQFPSSNSPSK